MPLNHGSLMKKYNLTLDCLDYKYIEECKNPKQLEKIYKVLTSGEEGNYPDLIKFCKNRLAELVPNSKYLCPMKNVLKLKDISLNEIENIQHEIYKWEAEMNDLEKSLNNNKEFVAELPSIRKIKSTTQCKDSNTKEVKNKKIKPQSYEEWEKYNVEEELNKLNDTMNKNDEKNILDHKSKGIDIELSTKGLSEKECKYLANLERIKGNEAFKAKDYEEAVLYYSRSLSAYVFSNTLNNRAQAYINLKKYVLAILDCSQVILMEPTNIKAFYRRGIAYKEQEIYDLAKSDFYMILQIDFQNKLAKDQIKAIIKLENEKSCQQQKVLIEEIDENNRNKLSDKTKSHKEAPKEPGIKLTIEEVDYLDNYEMNETNEMFKICQIQNKKNKENDLQIHENSLEIEYNSSSKTHNDEPKSMIQQLDKKLNNKPNLNCIKDQIQINNTVLHIQEEFLNIPIVSTIDNEIQNNVSTIDNEIQNNVSTIDNKIQNKDKKYTKSLDKLNEKHTKTSNELNDNFLMKQTKFDLDKSNEKIICKNNKHDVLGHNNENLTNPIKEKNYKFTEERVLSDSQDFISFNDEESENALRKELERCKTSRKNITPYEFLKLWNSNNAHSNSINGAKCLILVEPKILPVILTNKLDGFLLISIFKAIYWIAKAGCYNEGYAYLNSMIQVSRMNLIIMFFTNEEKKVIEITISLLEGKGLDIKNLKNFFLI